MLDLRKYWTDWSWRRLGTVLGKRWHLWGAIAAVSSILLLPTPVLAQETDSPGLLDTIDALFSAIVAALEQILFLEVFGIPLIVLWLIGGAIFFTLRTGFINIRGFKHGIEVVLGKYDDPNDEGEVTHFQALATALSGTVGLGNIAGVAIAIQLGGPGAMVWMTLGGLFGMASKFTECTLAQKYRSVKPDGSIAGGPMYYLTRGIGGGIGQGLAVLFSLLCIFAAFGGGNMFQANQAYAAVANVAPGVPDWGFGLLATVCVGIVIIGGIRRIAVVTGSLVPLMAVIYVLACLWIIGVNIPQIPAAIATIIGQAFAPEAVGGGFVGVLVQGIRRSAFSNEAGIGSAAIAHSAARTKEPVREGIVALLEPFIDTVVICNLTALVIVLTNAYQNSSSDLDGVTLTATAFDTVIDWFPTVLTVAVVLFAFSTMISWSYYGEKAWSFLFGDGTVIGFRVLYVGCVFLGTVVNLGAVLAFSDMMLLSMSVPNLLGCYLLSGQAVADLNDYMSRLRAGELAAYRVDGVAVDK